MAAINFNQVAGPNFGNSNELRKLALETGNKAFTGLSDTFTTAMGAVQNRNQAEMQNIINQQSIEQLNNPQNIQNLLGQFQDIAAPTGGNYDPTIMQAALDGRQDTLQARQGVLYDNMDANIGVQQGKTDLENTIVTNKQEQERIERETKAALESARVTKASNALGAYMRKTANLDPVKDAAAIQAAKAERNDFLAQEYPEGIPLDIEQQIYQLGEDSTYKSMTNKLNIEGKDLSNRDLAARTADRAARFQLEQQKLSQNTGIQARDRAVASGLSAAVINDDGSFNGKGARQDLMTRITNAQRTATSPANAKPFAERVNEVISGGGENPAISPEKLRQVQIALNSYSNQSKNGKSLQLSEDDKWAVFQGIMSGEIQSDGISIMEFAGTSNYQGLFEKVIPQFIERRKKQTIPANNNLIAAQEVGNYMQGLASLGDQVYMVEEMGITPGTPLFMYLPESLRQVLDPNNTDKRRYTDVPTANVAADMENKVKNSGKTNKNKTGKPSEAKGGKQKTVFELRNGY